MMPDPDLQEERQQLKRYVDAHESSIQKHLRGKSTTSTASDAPCQGTSVSPASWSFSRRNYPHEARTTSEITEICYKISKAPDAYEASLGGRLGNTLFNMSPAILLEKRDYAEASGYAKLYWPPHIVSPFFCLC
ncbi:hypothetical protein AAE478_010140 [Parahypoxylon ruwenzoriense]